MPIASAATVLMDQIGPNPSYTFSNYALGSQMFGSGEGSTTSVAAIDDFQVSSPTHLVSLKAVIAEGYAGVNPFLGFTNVQSWGLEIYSSPAAAASNLSGDVASLSLPPSSAVITDPFGPTPSMYLGRILIEFGLGQYSLNLATGDYWVALVPRLDYAYGALVIEQSTYAGTWNAYQANPGGGFGFPGNLQPMGMNLAYELTGESVPEPSTVLLLLAGAVMVFGLRRFAIIHAS